MFFLGIHVVIHLSGKALPLNLKPKVMKKHIKKTALLLFVVLIQACTSPVANFVFSDKIPRVGQTVHLNDRSVYEPNAWAWSIEPSSYYYLAGTDFDSEDLSIVFETGGLYSVTLQVWNSHGTDIQQKYIKVLNGKN